MSMIMLNDLIQKEPLLDLIQFLRNSSSYSTFKYINVEPLLYCHLPFNHGIGEYKQEGFAYFFPLEKIKGT